MQYMHTTSMLSKYLLKDAYDNFQTSTFVAHAVLSSPNQN